MADNLNSQLCEQLDTLMKSVHQKIKETHLEEDVTGNKEKSEALCEEWWEWIVAEWESGNAEVVFVPEEWQTI